MGDQSSKSSTRSRSSGQSNGANARPKPDTKLGELDFSDWYDASMFEPTSEERMEAMASGGSAPARLLARAFLAAGAKRERYRDSRQNRVDGGEEIELAAEDMETDPIEATVATLSGAEATLTEEPEANVTEDDLDDASMVAEDVDLEDPGSPSAAVEEDQELDEVERSVDDEVDDDETVWDEGTLDEEADDDDEAVWDEGTLDEEVDDDDEAVWDEDEDDALDGDEAEEAEDEDPDEGDEPEAEEGHDVADLRVPGGFADHDGVETIAIAASDDLVESPRTEAPSEGRAATEPGAPEPLLIPELAERVSWRQRANSLLDRWAEKEVAMATILDEALIPTWGAHRKKPAHSRRRWLR